MSKAAPCSFDEVWISHLLVYRLRPVFLSKNYVFKIFDLYTSIYSVKKIAEFEMWLYTIDYDIKVDILNLKTKKNFKVISQSMHQVLYENL